MQPHLTLGISKPKDFTSKCSDKIQVLKNLDLKRRYRKMDGQKVLLMRTCLDINTKRPNDKIQVTYTRNGKNNVVPVVFK
jgi:hypothetical protein